MPRNSFPSSSIKAAFIPMHIYFGEIGRRGRTAIGGLTCGWWRCLCVGWDASGTTAAATNQPTTFTTHLAHTHTHVPPSLRKEKKSQYFLCSSVSVRPMPLPQYSLTLHSHHHHLHRAYTVHQPEDSDNIYLIRICDLLVFTSFRKLVIRGTHKRPRR